MHENVDLSARFEIQLDVCGKCGWHGFIEDLVPESLSMPMIANEVTTPLSDHLEHTLKFELFLASEVVKCPTCGQVLRIIIKGLSDKDHAIWHEHRGSNAIAAHEMRRDDPL